MKHKIRLKAKKFAASILVASMAVTLIPKMTGTDTLMAAGTKDGSNTCLGISGIAAPEAPASEVSAWSGSYVYFGNFEGNPMRFRVLAPSTTAYGGTTMFLDCDSALFEAQFDVDDGDNPQATWATCSLREYLNTYFLDDCFTSMEQNVIAPSTVASHPLVEGTGAGNVGSDASYYFAEYTALTGEKIFLLDAEELSNPYYGYSVDDCTVTRLKDGRFETYWIRNSEQYDGDNYYEGLIEFGDDEESGCYTAWFTPYDVWCDVGVAPALNVDLSSFIFATAISGDLNASGSEYILTIADDDLTIAVPSEQNVTATGTTITVPYQIEGTDAGTATRASVLILDKTYGTSDAQILYYDALGGTFSNSAAAAGTFTLPESLDIADWGTDYYVYILAEDINGEKETDFASLPVAIAAPAAPSYTVTYSVVNGTWSDGTTADITESVEEGSTPASVPSGMIASSGYTEGAWDTDPATSTITEDTTFTYTFEAVPTPTPTPTSTSTSTPTPAVTLIPTVEPTAAPTAAASSDPIVTPSPAESSAQSVTPVPTATPTPVTSTSVVPQTGEDMSLLFCIGIGCVSAAGLLCAVAIIERKKTLS